MRVGRRVPMQSISEDDYGKGRLLRLAALLVNPKPLNPKP